MRGSKLCILLEWVPGGSARRLVEMLGPLPETTIAGFAAQAVRGLDWLHRHKIIHCDVKVSPPLV
jgi:serine/threonine protein kinase